MSLSLYLTRILLLGVLLVNTSLYAQPDLTKADPERANAATILIKPYGDPRILNRMHERVPSLAVSADGKTIYVAWYSGGKEEGNGNYVTLSVSTDGGRSWKNDELVVFPADTSSRCFDPALWRDPQGQVWLFYAVSLHNRYWDLKGGVNALAISWDGEKINHGSPRLVSYGIMMNKPVYIPQKKMSLFPVSVWQIDSLAPEQPGYIPSGTFIKSDRSRGGKKGMLSELKDYSRIVMPDSSRTFDEHMLVQVSDDGEMLCFIRGLKRTIYYARSKDYGKSWSRPEPFRVTGPTTSSRFYIGRLQSGNLLLVMNDNRNRLDMTAFLSEDGGKTWPYKLLIDARDWVSYPDIDQAPDGTIHLTYDRERTKDMDILYGSFREEDIRSNRQDNIFRQRVNQ